MRPAQFFGVLFGLQAALIGAGQGLLFLLRRDDLLSGLRPGLPLSMILGVGGGAGLVGALVVLGLYRFSPAYAGAVRPVVELFRRTPRSWLWVAAVASPFGEEMFFRGALQPVIGLFWSALTFGLLHTGFRRENLAYGLTAAGIGLLFGLSYQFLGELWAPVVAHAVYNVLMAVALPVPLTSGASFGMMSLAVERRNQAYGRQALRP
ncbi:MAG TPA: CPBP family intramembrane metalloprotease [Firmicutes bacterium]|nr:CPBP family intramembrane metalloprotease [Bacillota bacterium]